MKRHTFTVSQVAALTHLRVRALHHYDGIGLLRPSRRSPANYRLYDEVDLQCLRKVLLFRELGFSLDAVRGLLDASAAQQRDALIAQRAVTKQERRHAEAVLLAVDATLGSLKEQAAMTTEKLFDGFDHFENGEYAGEPEQRWRNTDAWKESRRRVHALTNDDRLPSTPSRRLSSPIFWPRAPLAIRPIVTSRPSWPNATAGISTSASIPAAMRCGQGSPTCTKPIRAFATTTTGMAKDSPITWWRRFARMRPRAADATKT